MKINVPRCIFQIKPYGPAISDFLIGPLKFASQSPSAVRFLLSGKAFLSRVYLICLCLRGVFYTANFFFHRLFEISAHTTRTANECCSCFNDRSRFQSPCLSDASTARLNAFIRSKEAMYRGRQFSTLHLRLAKGLFQLAVVAILPIYVFCTSLNR